MDDSLRTQLLKLLVIVAVIVGIVGAVLRWQYMDLVTVNNDAMAPTVFGGDQILVWRGTDFDHGDIVLCRHPRQQGSWILSRVIGRPGMSIDMHRGQLAINGQRVNRDYQGEVTFEDQHSHAPAAFRWGFEELGEVDHLFMERADRQVQLRSVERIGGFYLLNDNRTWVGDDSRLLGPISNVNCVGWAFMRWAPGGRAPEALDQGWLDILD